MMKMPNRIQLEQEIDDIDDEMVEEDYSGPEMDDIMRDKDEIEKKLGSRIVKYIRSYPQRYAALGGLIGVTFGSILTYANTEPKNLAYSLIIGGLGLAVGVGIGFKSAIGKAYRRAQRKFPKQAKDIEKLEKITEGYYIG